MGISHAAFLIIYTVFEDNRGVYSDVDINFHSKHLSSVTSLTLDATNDSRRSSNDLPTQINQLLIDIQALDDAEIALSVRENPETVAKNLKVSERMPRFTSAFNRMFDTLSYSRIVNQNGRKSWDNPSINIVANSFGTACITIK